MEVPDWMIELAERDSPIDVGEITITRGMICAGFDDAFAPDANEPADCEAIYIAMERRRRIELIALERWKTHLESRHQ